MDKSKSKTKKAYKKKIKKSNIKKKEHIEKDNIININPKKLKKTILLIL